MFGETCQIAKFCAFYCMNYSYKKERGAGEGKIIRLELSRQKNRGKRQSNSTIRDSV